MSQPLLSEEMLDLTLEELINEHGAELYAQETWYGQMFLIKISGTVITAIHPDQEAYDYISLGDVSQYVEEEDKLYG